VAVLFSHQPLVLNTLLTMKAVSQVKLRSSDNQMFEVPEEVAFESATVKNLTEGEFSLGHLASVGVSCVLYNPIATLWLRIKRVASDQALGRFIRCMTFFRGAADTGITDPIPLPNVNSKILAKVVEYAKYHVEARKTVTSEDKPLSEKPSKSEEEIKAWDKEFVKVDQGTLFELILVSFQPLTLCICGALFKA
jgi:Skp1 family, tetramerisation domain